MEEYSKIKIFYIKNILWILFFLCIIFVPIVITFIYFDINLLTYTSITGYAIISILYFIFKILFSILNFRNSNKYMKEIDEMPSIGVQITGWREDEELFEKTLIAIKYQSYKNIKKILFCSDGNEEEDMYMAKIFKKIFPTSQIIYTDKKVQDMNEVEIINFNKQILKNKYSCILQPHGGKRHAMYTQLKILSSEHLNCDLIMLVDSDCIYAKDAIEILVKTYVNSDATAVTGDVKIYNPINLLSYLIQLKFWFAFNMERNAQSYFGVVSCVPGPFGLYDSKMIKIIIDEWINQKLWGKECTFGDDRHLTNLTLMYKGKIYYNHRAICYTDTPTKLKRFISQQTRWGKSFIREYFYNINSFSCKSMWLGFELTFTFFVAYYVIFFIIYMCIKFNITNLLFITSSLFFLSYIRCFYAMWMSKNFSFIIYPLYSYIYLCILFPIKIWSGITLNVTKWGTGNRLTRSSISLDSYPIILWNIFLIFSFGYSLYKKYGDYDTIDYILFLYTFFNTFGLLLIYICIKNKYKNKIMNILNQIIVSNNIENIDYKSIDLKKELIIFNLNGDNIIEMEEKDKKNSIV